MNTPDRAQSEPKQPTVHEFKYPFIRTYFSEMDGEGFVESHTWSPGVRFEPRGPEETRSVADGVGAQIVTEVARFKPPGFPERVFYTRQWRDPDGKVFGKRALRVLAKSAFTTLIGGYRHKVDLVPAQEPPARSHGPAQLGPPAQEAPDA